MAAVISRRSSQWHLVQPHRGESQTLGASFETEADAVKAARGAAMARQVAHTVRTEEGPSKDESAYERHPRDLIG